MLVSFVRAHYIALSWLAAQSFAAELMTKDGVTRLLIGGGYGITSSSKTGEPHDDPAVNALMNDFYDQYGADRKDSYTPEIRNEVFEVEIHDERCPCFADRTAKGAGWEWDFFDLPSSLLPTTKIDLWGGSSTLHVAMHACDEDFSKSPEGAVIDNDEDTVFGRRVELEGLKSRSDLNGSIGRAGSWISLKGRYQVFVPKWESGGPYSVAVRSSNLRFASPLMLSPELDEPAVLDTPPPSITGVCVKSTNDLRGPLDVLLRRKEPTDIAPKSHSLSDSYHGPLTSRVDAILQEVCFQKPGPDNVLNLIYVPAYVREGMKAAPLREEMRIKSCRYDEFVAKLMAEDKPRAKLYETDLRSSRDKSSWEEWLRLIVTIDGLTPSVERVLVVSPNISMHELHHQILCPSSK